MSSLEEKYKVMLFRKSWKELSNVEKRLFEWFEKELNGDTACSAMFAVDLYEQVIQSLIITKEQQARRECRTQMADFIKVLAGDDRINNKSAKAITEHVITHLLFMKEENPNDKN